MVGWITTLGVVTGANWKAGDYIAAHPDIWNEDIGE